MVSDLPSTGIHPESLQNSFNIFLKLNPFFKFLWFFNFLAPAAKSFYWASPSFHVSTESAWGGQEKTPGDRLFRLNPPNSVIAPRGCFAILTCASATNESLHTRRNTSTVRFQWRPLYLVDNIIVDLSGFISVLWCNHNFWEHVVLRACGSSQTLVAVLAEPVQWLNLSKPLTRFHLLTSCQA